MRITRGQKFMAHAEVEARRATCFRRSVGSVIVRNSQIVSTGYNGPAARQAHCTGLNCQGSDGCKRAIHAEDNAIHRLPLWPNLASYEELTLYTTESPCMPCSHLIIEAGVIKRVFYMHEYRIRDGIELMLHHGVGVFRMTASGYVIDEKTGDLCDDLGS